MANRSVDEVTRHGDPGRALGEAAAAWATSRRIDVGRSSVRYREAGSGFPLVLVHGLGVSADYWVRNGPAIAAAGFRVLAADLPGFGLTDGPDGGLGVGEQARALWSWCEVMGIRSAVFLGHSISCQTILELAARHPPIVRGLVLAAPTGDGGAVPRLGRQALGLLRDIRREPFLLATLVAQAYLRAGPLKVLRTWRKGATHDPLPLLRAIRAPGIVILGGDDPVVGRDFAATIASGLNGGRLVLVPGSAHAVIFDPSGTFNTSVIDFLRRVAG